MPWCDGCTGPWDVLQVKEIVEPPEEGGVAHGAFLEMAKTICRMKSPHHKTLFEWALKTFVSYQKRHDDGAVDSKFHPNAEDLLASAVRMHLAAIRMFWRQAAPRKAPSS